MFAVGQRTAAQVASSHFDLVRASATDMITALRRRAVSAVELCKAVIARVERLDHVVNAVVVRDFERALADARAADAALARGDERPLLGVPMTVKEAFDLEGHPTTFGLEQHRGHRALTDADVVARVRRGGAIVLGKTNVPTGLSDWLCANALYGVTTNPYDPSRTPGGSSGGASAALAMRFSALEIGSDFGGSLRVPAAFCGVFALKPSFGAVSLLGHAPGGVPRAPRDTLVAGPMARTADDLALLLGVVAGPDRETAATALQFPAARADRISDYRVLVLDHHPIAPLSSEIRDALSRAEVELRRAGARVSRTSGRLPDLEAVHQTARRMGRARGPDRDTMTVRQWFEVLEEQYTIRRQFAALFETIDVVVTAAFGTTAFPYPSEPDVQKRTLSIDGQETPYGNQIAWTAIASVAGLPAAVAPVGVDKQGLPIGLQVIAPFLGDLTAIRFAGLLARDIPPPSVAAVGA